LEEDLRVMQSKKEWRPIAREAKAHAGL
jgi:hypothetical protein